MLRAFSTPKHVGIALFGDFHDLEALHKTIHQLSNHPLIPENQRDFMLGLAYEVRKSFEGQREKKSFGTGADRVKYFGAKNIWPFFLTQVAMLRSAARLQPCTALHQSHLYLLEHLVYEALAQKDGKVAHFCREWLLHFTPLTPDYLLAFIEDEVWKYVTQVPSEKRLNSLPILLRNFHWFSDEYRAFQGLVALEAKKRKGNPIEFGIKRDWPDYEW